MEMSGRISGWEKSSLTVEHPVAIALLKAACASAMVETQMSPTFISQAPLSRERHRGIRAPGVPGDIQPKNRRLSEWARQRPAVRCFVMSNLRRSMTSSNASKYGSGDMYTVAMSGFPMRYSATISDGDVALALDMTPVGIEDSCDARRRAAAAVMGRRVSRVSRNGNGAVMHNGGSGNLSVAGLQKVIGGQGACDVSGRSTGSSSESASRPRSYRSCAAGGRLCCRYQASSNCA